MLNKNYFLLLFLILLSFCIACLPIAQFRKSLNQPQPSSNTSVQNNKDFPAEEIDLISEDGKIEHEIYQYLINKDFKTIEKLADEARKNKTRLTGGIWKIDVIYAGTTVFYAEYPGQKITDELSKNRIELLKSWKEQSPESITPRVAVASAYLNYGWFARGSGYMNTVSNEDKRLFSERLSLAENELFEAKKLNEKCPRWYWVLLYLGLNYGWSAEDFNSLFEEAVEFEPNYLLFYLVKSTKLTPKWGGKPGEWQTFFDSLPNKLATLDADEADIIYFIVGAREAIDDSFSINFSTFSKERIKNGYKKMCEKYGNNNRRLNQYAFLTVKIGDFESARDAIRQIGKNRDNKVWGEQSFNMIKQIVEQADTRQTNSK